MRTFPFANLIHYNITTTCYSTKVDITDISKPMTVSFTYSVEFKDDPLEWKHRMTTYTNSIFAPQSSEIHWLSIINSCVLVLLLTAFLAIIFMRVLKNDFSHYMDIEEEIIEEEEVCLSSSLSSFMSTWIIYESQQLF